MIASIQLDNKFSAYACKVGNKVSNDMLTLECDSQSFSLQIVPKQCFSLSWIISVLSGIIA